MKMAFVTHTPLAGMPWRTMRVCDAELRKVGGWARSITKNTAYGRRSYPFDLEWKDPESQQVLHDCDVIIVTAYMGFEEFAKYGKPICRHLSTEQKRWVEKEPNPDYHTVVAQYQARFAKRCAVLPNCIPIDHPMWQPEWKPEDRVIVVYTPTSKATSGWASKGYEQTVDMLRRLCVQYKDALEVVVLQNTPYEDVMRARRHAHIVIDECATGSYHSTALEGLACGAASICWVDGETEKAFLSLYDSTNRPEALPFTRCTQSQLRDLLRTLIANPDMLEMQGKAARRWMERHYSSEWQARKWLDWHSNFLLRSRASTRT